MSRIRSREPTEHRQTRVVFLAVHISHPHLPTEPLVRLGSPFSHPEPPTHRMIGLKRSLIVLAPLSPLPPTHPSFHPSALPVLFLLFSSLLTSLLVQSTCCLPCDAIIQVSFLFSLYFSLRLRSAVGHWGFAFCLLFSVLNCSLLLCFCSCSSRPGPVSFPSSLCMHHFSSVSSSTHHIISLSPLHFIFMSWRCSSRCVVSLALHLPPAFITPANNDD